MTPALLFALLVIPFFVVLSAWVYVVWPEQDPTNDALWERRRG